MATIVVKAYLEYPDTSVETRRFTLEKESIGNPGVYNRVHEQVGKVFPSLKEKNFTLFWKDDEDDFVTVSTDEEIQDMMAKDTCKFYIKVNEDQPTNTLIQDSTTEEEMVAEESDKGNHQVADPMENVVKSVQGGLLTHPPLPPPPPFGFHGWKRGPWGWKGRGRHMHRHGHDHEDGRHGGPWGHHHGWPMGHHHRGRRGDRSGNRSDEHSGDEWGHQGHGGHHGGPWGHHHGGKWGHHHGGHKDRQCEGHGKRFKHGGCGRRFSPERQGKSCHGGKHAWKNDLREVVPKSHRQWAKAFIQNWRKEHLKNATTTTSDSDSNVDWKAMMASEGIPEAYADWLKVKLICWHAKSSKDEMENVLGDESLETHKQIKKALKASVLLEFRKWVKWYINKHFGERNAPKFKKHFGGCRYKDMMAMKKRAFENTVPKGFQLWTKQFIRDWRAERKLDEPSDNDGMDSGMNGEPVEPTQVPDEYKRWLEMFLQRWHTWRGQIQRTPGQKMGGMRGEFAFTVPGDYRCWVKFYLSSRYNNKKNGDEGSCATTDDLSQRKYNKMLHAFQKLWVQDQQQGDSTTDDDGKGFLSNSSDDENGEPESSFQHLSLDSDSDGAHRRVRFDEHSEKKRWKKMKKHMKGNFDTFMFDEDDDLTRFQRKVPINFEFRQFAKQALSQWNGKTVDEDSDRQHDGQQDEDFNLPPNIYHWMSKIMMKNQMKMMKQEMKAAKKEMKMTKKMEKKDRK